MNKVDSRPLLTASFPVGSVGVDAVAWLKDHPVAIGRATVAVLPFLDGSTSLDELLDDAVSALGLGPDAVEGVLGDLRRLDELGAVAGVGPLRAAPPVATPAGDGTDVEAVTPGGLAEEVDGVEEVLDVFVDGNQRIVTTRLADGRIRRTTSIEVSSARSTDQLQELLGSVGLTDVIDTGSCAAQKLRAGEPATDLVVDVDGRLTRIRCDHPPATDALRVLFGDSLVDDAELVAVSRDVAAAPADVARSGVGVSAYVVAPFEGDGPPRVYDRWASRVGRPRDAEGVAVTVAALLADEQPVDGSGGAVLNAFVVDGPKGCVLLPAGLAELPLIRHRLERVGLVPQASRRVLLRPGGTVEIGGGWPVPARRVREVVGCVCVGADTDHDAATVFAAGLLRGVTPASVTAAQRILEVLDTVIGDVPVRRAGGGDVSELVELCTEMAS